MWCKRDEILEKPMSTDAKNIISDDKCRVEKYVGKGIHESNSKEDKAANLGLICSQLPR